MSARILACFNVKGGVGKTAAAVNLSYAAATGEERVLVWDLDAQGAASYYFRIKPKFKGGSKSLVRGRRRVTDFIKGTNYPNLDLMPADFSNRHLDIYLHKKEKTRMRLRQLLRPVANEYDLIVLDCAPALSLVAENIFTVADVLLVPVIPTNLSLRAYDQLAGYLRKRDRYSTSMLPFFSMVDCRKKLHKEMLTVFASRYPAVLGSVIPYSSHVELMGKRRAPVQCVAASSAAAHAFNSLWQEIHERLPG